MQQTALLGFLSSFRGRDDAGGSRGDGGGGDGGGGDGGGGYAGGGYGGAGYGGGGYGWKPADEQVLDPSQLGAEGGGAGVGGAGAGGAGAGGVPPLGVAHFDPPQIPDLKTHRAGFGPPRPLGSGPGVPIIDAELSDDPELWRQLETHPQLPAPAPAPTEAPPRPTGFPPRPPVAGTPVSAPGGFGAEAPPGAPTPQPVRPSILPGANGFAPAGTAARMRMPAADSPLAGASSVAGAAAPAPPVPPAAAPDDRGAPGDPGVEGFPGVAGAQGFAGAEGFAGVAGAQAATTAPPAQAFAPHPSGQSTGGPSSAGGPSAAGAGAAAPAPPVNPTGLPIWPPPGASVRPAAPATPAAPTAPASRPRFMGRSKAPSPAPAMAPAAPTPGPGPGDGIGAVPVFPEHFPGSTESPSSASVPDYLSWPPPPPGSIPWRLPVPAEYLPKLSWRERATDVAWEIMDRLNWGRAGMILVVAGALVGAGLVAAGRLEGPGYPSSWDPRVAQIASFVQTDRGLAWKHPVRVEFLAPPEFVKKIGGKQAPDNTLADAQLLGMYRAAGLISGNVSLSTAGSALLDNEVIGMYVPADKVVYVRGDAVTPDVRVTLAHELTHALQDQYFNITGMEGGRSDGEQAATALIEGDAVRVQDDYARTLSPRDQALLVREQAAESARARRANVADHIPAFLVDQSTFPYDFGPAFVEALYQRGGNAAVNSAFRRPPSLDGQIIEPASYQAGVAVPKPVLPPLPRGAKILQRPTGFGELPLLEAIGNETGFQVAWNAVQGWSADQMEGYQLGGRSCISVATQLDNAADAGRLYTAALSWAAAIPGAAITASGETVQLQSCDPGVRWKPRQGGPDPYDALAARAFWVGELVSSAKLSPATSGCVVDGLMSRLGAQVLSAAAQAQSPTDPNVRAVVGQLQAAAAGCRA